MGRNYESELELVGATAEWAASLDLSGAIEGFSRLQCQDLVVIASGGSVAAAQLLTQLHSYRSGRLAVLMTPLEFVAETHPLDAAAWFISAGGGNNDILQAWHAAPIRAVQDVALLCANSDSSLARLAHGAGIRASVVFDVPAGRDGFLATNSLVAFYSVILRLYGITPPALPERPRPPATTEILERRTLVILYGGWLKSIAIDLESRFTEAALGSVQTADYRNFAHGRHNWLAKRGADTGVLALFSPAFAALARDTLAEVPPDVSIERWEFSDDSPAVALLGLQRALELAGVAAARLGYDAGRPGVPEFGHRIYELQTPPQRTIPTTREVAIARKLRTSGKSSEHHHLHQALTQFETSLHDARLSGIVLDYDGTIVATARRFEAIEPAIAAELNRLLDAGFLIGVATGRGKSVHDKLRAAITPVHWPRCAVGYYNGGIIRSLEDSCDGLTDVVANPAIIAANAALRRAPELAGTVFDTRALQITVTRAESAEHGLWMKVRSVLERANLGTLKVVQSSHSVDVIPFGVSKAAVVEHVALRANVGESALLKIGDRGRWPGNDADLLAMSHGLSVDEVSGHPDSCWNLVPLGLAGPLATLYYLERARNGRYVPEMSS
jgi:hydroxymethylpyrimidine pyrophosphatase-like HAD family hydrolase